MSDITSRPPRFALWLLRRFAGQRDYDFAAGDLTETYERLAKEEGLAAARRWFMSEVLRGMPGFVKNSLYWKIAMWKSYATIVVRNTLRSPLFAVLNLFGLAIGMACFILISLWIKDETSFDRFHAKKDRLYLLMIVHPNGIHDYNSPYALAPVLADQYPEIAAQSRVFELSNTRACSICYQSPGLAPVQFYENQVILVDPAFFTMFSFPFKCGSPEAALPNPSSVVISEAAAVKYFGLENPLGKTMILNNGVDLTVTGVVRVPSHSHLRFDFAAPLPPAMKDNWNWADPSFVLLKEGMSLTEFNKKIAGSLNQHFPQPLRETFRVEALPLTEAYLHFGRKTYVYVFSVIAAFILLIACINYMNLSTASSSNRVKEVGLRKVVGAQHSQLVQQFLGESLIMSALALILSLAFVRASLPLLNSLTAKQLSFHLLQNPGLLLFLAGLVVTVGVLAGTYPAFFLSAVRPVETLKASLRFRSGRSAFRVITVVGQFALSVLLIACTAAVFKQLTFMRNLPLGFRTDHIIKVPLNQAVLKNYSSFKTELERNPNVLTITAGQAVPYDDDYKTSGVEWEGKDPDLSPLVRYSITQADYIETFGMQMAAGRSFSREYPNDWENFIINEEAARYMGMAAPVGQRLQFWGRDGTIIGVVKDFHHVSLHREILPQIIAASPRLHGALKYIFIKISAENIPGTIAVLREAAERHFSGFPFEYSFIDQGIGALYASEQRLGKIFGYFAFLAILISCLGIFGLAAFSAEKRTKEIGVRRVLGASIPNITAMLSREFSRWLAAANLIAWPVGWYFMHRWLENFAYRTGLTLWLFLLAGLLSFAIAAVPVGFQCLKAAASNPVDSLRYE